MISLAAYLQGSQGNVEKSEFEERVTNDKDEAVQKEFGKLILQHLI